MIVLLYLSVIFMASKSEVKVSSFCIVLLVAVINNPKIDLGSHELPISCAVAEHDVTILDVDVAKQWSSILWDLHFLATQL